MIKVLIIKPDESITIQEISPTLENLQSIVGGYIELIPFGPMANAYINEDGIALNLPRNQLATMLAEHFLNKMGRILLRGDYIKGTMIVVGLSDDEGNNTDVPSDVVDEVDSFLKV